MMCVPGVQAHAARGSSAPNAMAPTMNTAARTRRAASGRVPRADCSPASDAELAPLPLDRLAKIFELRLDRVADAIARFLEEFADRLADLLRRHLVPEILALVGYPRRSAPPRLRAGPRSLIAGNPRPLRALARGAQDRHQRTLALRALPEQQRRPDAERN